MATTTSSINHQDIHHQPGVTLHQLAQQMSNCKSSLDSAKSSICSDATAEDLIFFHTQSNPIMDFLLEGDNGSSRESLANLLDEGLGTSLDGTDELCTTHPTLGRNDSGVFSSDETVMGIPANQLIPSSTASTPLTMSSESTATPTSSSCSSVEVHHHKKHHHRPKNTSPNRQGPQRCAICGKTFSNASALTKHKLTHSDERKHSCTVCGKAFKRQDHLNGHMLTHRSKKPFECSANNCGKSYCDARSLRRHIESRHGPEALATMTIAPTPHSPSDFNIIIPPPTTTIGKGKRNTAVTNSTKTQTQNHMRSVKLNAANPLLCQGSNSPGNTSAEENELLTSVENLLNLEDSSVSAVTGDNSTALLDSSLIEMGVIQEEMEDVAASIEMELSADKLNNNDCEKDDELCCKRENGHNSLMMDVGAKLGHMGQNGFLKKSQLHQLLTQRALTLKSGNDGSTTCGESENESDNDSATATAAVTLIKESLIASCTNNGTNMNTAFQLDLNHVSSWGSTERDSEMGKSVRGVELGGIVLKCPSSPSLSSPQSLKEQLELIHQIIQQTTEESAAYTNSNIITTTATANIRPLATSTSTTTSKKKSNKVEEKVESQAPSGNSGSGDELNLNLSLNIKANEDKPVECTICCRRFKNTPALNGHMRLHGGYFKKDSDGKKKEQSSKESVATPLQTASVSVRALIEEKIIQRRNTIINTQAAALSGNGDKSALVSAPGTPKTPPASTSTPTTPTKKFNQSQPSLAPVPSNCSNPLGFLQSAELNFTKSNAFSNQAFNFNSAIDFPTQDNAHADYLLIEEEVFNKVSSICPDSFFSGIEESLYRESGIGTGSDSSCEQISAEYFNWATTSVTTPMGSNSLFNGPATPTTTSPSSGSDNPFTPLPSLDPVFFTPTPGSNSSHHSHGGEDLADSPSFIYPTPPASLESHNALQSPLFPFPFPFETSPQTGHNLITTSTNPSVQLSMSPLTSTTNLNTNYNSMNNGTSSLSPSLVMQSRSTSIPQNQTMVPMSTQLDNLLLTTHRQSSNSSINTVSGVVVTYSNPSTSGNQSVSNSRSNPSPSSGHVSMEDIKMVEMKVPPSPSISNSNSPSLLTSSTGVHKPLSPMKLNEPCPIMESSEESFRSPNRMLTLSVGSTASTVTPKGPKRKALRNTLASNLRPQSSQSPCHFTPYPILSPVRSAPGLYWTFSARLAHVDETKKERPRINIGANFQATIPPLLQNNKYDTQNQSSGYSSKTYEDILWHSDVVSNCSPEEVDKYLEFACCSAIPGGGRNKEYALHLLSLCNGDINAAILLLMNPEPKFPTHVQRYKYPEGEKWSRQEIQRFQDSLLRHGKDFLEVSKELGTKSVDECVCFYPLWKKVCPNEYEKIRSVWKKRDAAFTIELLKTIPPPTNPFSIHVDIPKIKMPKLSKSQQLQSPAPVQGLNLNEEFPCKVCGKIFSKVKSRSAHMKSHRPPPVTSTISAATNSPTHTSPKSTPALTSKDSNHKGIMSFKKDTSKSSSGNLSNFKLLPPAMSILPSPIPQTPSPSTSPNLPPFTPKIIKLDPIPSPPLLAPCFQHKLQLQAT